MLDIQAQHFALELAQARIHDLREEARQARFAPRLRLPRLPALFATRVQQPACCPA